MALISLLSISGCVGIGPARKYDCRITPGYSAKAVSRTAFDVTLYHASYWSKKTEATALAAQGNSLCGGNQYDVAEKDLGVEYLDGCFGPDDASGETHYLLTCK